MGNRTNYGTGRMTVDNRQKNERSRSGNPYSSHVKAGKHAGTVYNFKRKSRIRKSLTRLPILLEFIHKYIFLNFVSFYNGLNSNTYLHLRCVNTIHAVTFTPVVYFIVLFNLKPFSYCYITIHIMSCQQVIFTFVHIYFTFILFFRHSNGILPF